MWGTDGPSFTCGVRVFGIGVWAYSMETRKGLLTKLGLYSVGAIGFYLVGKRHIQKHNDERHKRETDARIDSETDEFSVKVKRPGFPENNPNFDYEERQLQSKYVGLGSSYSSRTPGDRFTMFGFFDREWGKK